MVEKSYPDLIPYLSSCKSPQMMLGAIIKNYFAELRGVGPADIMSCSIMPCVRKQGEADRPGNDTTGQARDVDHVITTAELGKILQVGAGRPLLAYCWVLLLPCAPCGAATLGICSVKRSTRHDTQLACLISALQPAAWVPCDPLCCMPHASRRALPCLTPASWL